MPLTRTLGRGRLPAAPNSLPTLPHVYGRALQLLRAFAPPHRAASLFPLDGPSSGVFFFLGFFPVLPLGCPFGAVTSGTPTHFLAPCSVGALVGVFLRITPPRIRLPVSLGLRPDPLGLACVGWLALARGAVAGEWALEGVHPARRFPVPIVVLKWGVGENKDKKRTRAKKDRKNAKSRTSEQNRHALLPARRARGAAATRGGARGRWQQQSARVTPTADGARRRAVVRGSCKKSTGLVASLARTTREERGGQRGGKGEQRRSGWYSEGTGGTARGLAAQRGGGGHSEGEGGTARGRGGAKRQGKEYNREVGVAGREDGAVSARDVRAGDGRPDGQQQVSRTAPPIRTEHPSGGTAALASTVFKGKPTNRGAPRHWKREEQNEMAGGGTFCRCTDESAAPLQPTGRADGGGVPSTGCGPSRSRFLVGCPV